MRRAPVEDFRYLSKAGLEKMFSKRLQESLHPHFDVLRRSVGLDERRDETSKQPGPNRALMVSAVPLFRRPFIARPVSPIRGRKAPQPIGRVEFFQRQLNYRAETFFFQDFIGQADGEERVGAYRRVPLAPV